MTVEGGQERVKSETTREPVPDAEEVCAFCNEPRAAHEFKDGLRCVYCAEAQDGSQMRETNEK